MAFTKATYDYLDAGGLINWQLTAKTATFDAVSGEGYLVDTSSAAITVTLPDAPSAGDEIIIVDYASNAGTNNITLDPGTLNLRGATDDLVLDNDNQTARLLYSGATKGWLVATEAGAGPAAAPALTVDYLVVAGGGGSASRNSGGGGAGGVLENFTSTSIDASVGTSYTVTVGSGGAAGAGGGNNSGSNGNNSVFDSYTSIGGGASNLRGSNGASGGSGGGASEDNLSSYVGGSGTPGPPIQGYDGGDTPLGGPASAGGGGAGGLGGNATSTSCGVGGLGIDLSAYLSSYGDSGYFASGGGGGTDDSSISGGSASSGGGARGRSISEGANVVGFSGDPNTGGGAGGGAGSGAATSHVAGGAGGSGVVILRYPDAYTISETTSPTVLTFNTYTEGSDKVTVFTAGENGTIQFST